MPILTPCAAAGVASSRLPSATAANTPDFMSTPPTSAFFASSIRNPDLATRSQVGEAAHQHIEDRREDQPEHGDAEHPEEYGDTDRLAHFGPRAGRKHQRQHAENERKRGHQNRTQSQPARLDDGVEA